MYLPVIYYPIQDDERATGFLLPTYGTSTLRGQALSNAFFWAIDRSQDATFFHDWFTRTGQGAGAEYRYVAGAQSTGDVALLPLRPAAKRTFTDDGQTHDAAGEPTASRSPATLNQALDADIRARARARLLLRHRHAAALSPEHLPGHAQPPR